MNTSFQKAKKKSLANQITYVGEPPLKVLGVGGVPGLPRAQHLDLDPELFCFDLSTATRSAGYMRSVSELPKITRPTRDPFPQREEPRPENSPPRNPSGYIAS